MTFPVHTLVVAADERQTRAVHLADAQESQAVLQRDCGEKSLATGRDLRRHIRVATSAREILCDMLQSRRHRSYDARSMGSRVVSRGLANAFRIAVPLG